MNAGRPEFSINVSDLVMRGQTEEPKFPRLVDAHKAVVAYRLAWGYLMGGLWGSKIKSSYKQDSPKVAGIELTLETSPRWGEDPKWPQNQHGWVFCDESRFYNPATNSKDMRFTYPILLDRDKNPGVPDRFWEACKALAENCFYPDTEDGLLLHIHSLRVQGGFESGGLWIEPGQTGWKWLLKIPRSRVDVHPSEGFLWYEWADLVRSVERLGSRIPTSPV